MVDFGTGTVLRDTVPWLRDPTTRHARILEVVERNSVIEGLPPFQTATRNRLLQKLNAMTAAEPSSAPDE
jgi:hypothetical protein